MFFPYSLITEPTGKGRFLNIVLLANSIHPTYTMPPTSASLKVGLGSAWLWWGELARLKRWWTQVT